MSSVLSSEMLAKVRGPGVSQFSHIVPSLEKQTLAHTQKENSSFLPCDSCMCP